jgi:hypothetical protein
VPKRDPAFKVPEIDVEVPDVMIHSTFSLFSSHTPEKFGLLAALAGTAELKDARVLTTTSVAHVADQRTRPSGCVEICFEPIPTKSLAKRLIVRFVAAGGVSRPLRGLWCACATSPPGPKLHKSWRCFYQLGASVQIRPSTHLYACHRATVDGRWRIVLERAGVTDAIEVVVADAGYWHQRQMEGVINKGIQVLIPPGAGKRRGTRPGWDG